jgi:hypothetical protein
MSADAGFTNVDVAPLGDRWSAALYLLWPFVHPRRPLRRWAAHLALRFDSATGTRWAERDLPRCPVGYCARASIDA